MLDVKARLREALRPADDRDLWLDPAPTREEIDRRPGRRFAEFALERHALVVQRDDTPVSGTAVDQSGAHRLAVLDCVRVTT